MTKPTWRTVALLFAPHASALCCATTTAIAQVEIRVVNYAPVRRHEWSLATVPFPQGQWHANADYRPEGLEGELTPFGARWPDGSIRQAQLAVRLNLGPSEERVIRIVAGTPQVPPFQLSPWAARGLGEFAWQLAASVQGVMKYAPFQVRRLVHNSESRKVLYCSARFPDTDLIYDLWLTVFSGQDAVPFELRITNSKVGSPAWKQEIDGLALGVAGGWCSFRGAVSRGIVTTEQNATAATHLLLGSTHFYDGQAQDWNGTLLFFRPEVPVADATLRTESLYAAMVTPFWGCATNWAQSAALGPFGHVPEHPSWITDERYATTLERGKFDSWYTAPGLPWDDLPKGLFPQAGSTGDQHDFGVVKMLHVFHTGLPDLIEEARHASSEEAHRPDHHRELDGSLVRSINHPDWVTWSGRTHFNRSVSSDRLGKPYPEPWPESHGWGSRDNQHWSSLTLAAGYLLTRSYSLEMDIDGQIEVYLAGHTLPTEWPGWPTNSIDSSRGVGRTLLTMSWLYLLTGRADLRERMTERIRQCIAVQWSGRNLIGPVRPITHSSPDPRIIGNYDFWRPWEDALAILGLEAAYRITGRAEARDIAMIGAKTLFTYGWRLVGTDWEIATGLRYRADGRPLTAAELADPTQAVWSQGVGFEPWALPAAKLARYYGAIYNDPELVTRAQAIIESIGRSRVVPFNRRWDLFYEWDAVR